MRYGSRVGARLAGHAELSGGDDIAGPLPQIANPHTVGFDSNDPNAWRRLPLPMDVLSLAAGASDTSTVQPQDIFKVRKINIPTAFDPATSLPVEGIFITEIKVGQASQLINGGQMDIRNFIPDAVSTYLDFDTGAVGNLFSITVENTSAVGPVSVSPTAIALVAVRR